MSEYENDSYWSYVKDRECLVNNVLIKMTKSYNTYVSRLDSELLDSIKLGKSNISDTISRISLLRTACIIIKEKIMDQKGEMFLRYWNSVEGGNFRNYIISNTILSMMLEDEHLIESMICNLAMSDGTLHIDFGKLIVCCSEERAFEENMYSALDMAIFKEKHGTYTQCS